MGEEGGCGNRKSDVTSLGRKLKLHLLVYTSRGPARCADFFSYGKGNSLT